MKSLLSGVMFLVCVLAMFLPFSPFFLWYFHSNPLPYSLWFVIYFCLIAAEKIYAMFFQMRDRNLFSSRQDWTAPAVGLAYTGTMYAVIIEFFWHGGQIFRPLITATGFGLYALALSLRYWAFHHLGHHWAVQLDRAESENPELVRTGPYAWVRHPLYTGACLEALAVPLIFNSFLAFLFGLFIFIPLEIKRAAFEERFLNETFGSDYEQYVAEVNGFMPRFRRVERKRI